MQRTNTHKSPRALPVAPEKKKKKKGKRKKEFHNATKSKNNISRYLYDWPMINLQIFRPKKMLFNFMINSHEFLHFS